LRKMKEPSLFTQPAKLEAYRLLVLFNSGGAVAVRIERRQGQHLIVSKKLASRDADYDPGPLVVDVQKKLSAVEWNAVVEKIGKMEFWDISTPVSPNAGTHGIVLHGTEWVLEGSRDGKYQVVDIYSPEAYGYKAFKEACAYLLSISGIAVS